MNKNIMRLISRKSASLFSINNVTKWINLNKKIRLYSSSSKQLNSSQPNLISHNFPYGQAGQLIFNLKNRTYNIQFQTIWQDYSSLSYCGLAGKNSFFILQQGNGKVKIDDLDLQNNQKQYIKMYTKIPQDYTIKGYINGSIRHIKNNISSKTRSNSFQLQIGGYKNIYQWLNLQCESMKLYNKFGDVAIDSLTTKDCYVECENFISKKVLFSGQVNIKATHKIQIRSIVAYQNALTRIINCQNVNIQSISGRCEINDCKNVTIDRILSLQQGINIKCDHIPKNIIIQTGSGVIQCLKQQKQILIEKIKLGKLHKGKIDFDSLNSDPNSVISKVRILV